MRAMRTYFGLAFVLVVAGCGSDTVKSPDMSIVVTDMTPGADLALRMPNGVACGNMTCATGKECCVTVTNNMPSTATCIDPGGSCQGGTVLACDGPEDCTSQSALYCCGTVMFTAGANADAGAQFNGGSSSCTGTCALGFAGGGVTSRLCHTDADCTGLTVPLVNTPAKCCSSAMAPGLHFSAGALGGITCP
jgi:hypothetical protein